MRRNTANAKYTAIYTSDRKSGSIDLVRFANNVTGQDMTQNERVQTCLKHFGGMDDLRESLGWYWNKIVETKFGITSKGKTELYVYLYD